MDAGATGAGDAAAATVAVARQVHTAARAAAGRAKAAATLRGRDAGPVAALTAAAAATALRGRNAAAIAALLLWATPPAAGGRGDALLPALLPTGFAFLLALALALRLHRLVAADGRQKHEYPAGESSKHAAAGWAGGQGAEKCIKAVRIHGEVPQAMTARRVGHWPLLYTQERCRGMGTVLACGGDYALAVAAVMSPSVAGDEWADGDRSSQGVLQGAAFVSGINARLGDGTGEIRG